MVNRSNYTLSDSQTNLLQHGLNFAITPKNVPTNDYITAIEKACKIIGPNSKSAQKLRAECVKIMKNAKPPSSNISKQEITALVELKQQNDIMILPADKGRSVVVMDKCEYVNKARELLQDEKTYKKHHQTYQRNGQPIL